MKFYLAFLEKLYRNIQAWDYDSCHQKPEFIDHVNGAKVLFVSVYGL